MNDPTSDPAGPTHEPTGDPGRAYDETGPATDTPTDAGTPTDADADAVRGDDLLDDTPPGQPDPPTAAGAAEPPLQGVDLDAVVDAGVQLLRSAAAMARVSPEDAERQIAELLAFLRRRLTADYEVDAFGFDEDFTLAAYLPLLRPLYRSWFRVEVRGAEHLPSRGGALVVANHSGGVPLDALMTQVAVHDDHPAHRHLRLLAADLAFRLPVVGDVARKTGSTLATHEDAERLLRAGELVGVWPEGFKGIGKPFSQRYRLQRFGRGGFVAAAMRAEVPIVPCSIVGAEETYPLLGNIAPLAKLLGLPYFPVTPTFPWLGVLGMVPLPSRWIIEFGEPVHTDELGPDAADDPMLVFDLTDRVRELIQESLYRLLATRDSAFFG